MKIDLYEALKVHRDAPMDVIKRAYRRAAKEAHPDSGGDRDRFALITLARDTLTNEKRREKYDRTGEIDEAKPDTLEGDAMQIALQAINIVITAILQRGGQVEQFDVIGDAVRGMESKIEEMKTEERGARAAAARSRKVAKRFKAKKGKVNRIGPMLEALASQNDDAAELAVRNVPIYARAIEIVQEHLFDIERGPAYGTQAQWRFPSASI